MFICVGFQKISTTSHFCLTIVVESVCDLVSDNHAYSTEVKGLVLLFAEERRLQDPCWKHWTGKRDRSDTTISKQDYNEERCLRFIMEAPGKTLTYLVSVG